LVGILQAVRFCIDGNAYIARDIGTGWFKVEECGHPPIPILIFVTEAMTIAGVRISRLDEEIKYREVREQIHKALEAISFHIMFTRKDYDEEKKKCKFVHTSLNKMLQHDSNY
jgi:hypothetical protein